MTTASAHDLRRPGAILSRLLVVLAVLLFALPQVHADKVATKPGPAAQDTVEQVVAISSAQRHLLRAQVQDDRPSDAVLPGAAPQSRPFRTVAATSPAPQQSLLPISIHIMPPVRGPPAV